MRRDRFGGTLSRGRSEQMPVPVLEAAVLRVLTSMTASIRRLRRV
jgi:hypothetical protein